MDSIIKADREKLAVAFKKYLPANANEIELGANYGYMDGNEIRIFTQKSSEKTCSTAFYVWSNFRKNKAFIILIWMKVDITICWNLILVVYRVQTPPPLIRHAPACHLLPRSGRRLVDLHFDFICTANSVIINNFAYQIGIFYWKQFAETPTRAQIDSNKIFLFAFYILS